jgi:NTE family protein
MHKDIDFSRDGIARRRAAGYADMQCTLEREPWREPMDPIEGIAVYRSGKGHQAA